MVFVSQEKVKSHIPYDKYDKAPYSFLLPLLPQSKAQDIPPLLPHLSLITPTNTF